MSPSDYQKLFEPLWDDLKGYDSYPAKRPLLAHYSFIPKRTSSRSFMKRGLENHTTFSRRIDSSTAIDVRELVFL